MPESIKNGQDGQLYEKCIIDLESKGDARYGICMSAYKEHHIKDPDGNWIRKSGHKLVNGKWEVSSNHSEFQELPDWIAIFRGGTQKDSCGNSHNGDEIIDLALSSFDVNVHEPPVRLDHNNIGGPSYGWIRSVKKEKNKDGINTLYAKLDLTEDMINLIKSGKFKKRSAGFTKDGILHHLAMLGSSVPAVKSLPDINLDDGEIEINNFNFEESEISKEKKAQESRSKKYKISIKDNTHVTKPSEYSNLSDDQFADPVNYRYPIDKEHILPAIRYWGKPKNKEEYSTAEQSIINKRIESAKKKFKIGENSNMEENVDVTNDTKLDEKIIFTEDQVNEKLEDQKNDLLNQFNEEIKEITNKFQEEKSKLEEEIKNIKFKQAKENIDKFLNGLVESGKILPKDLDGLKKFCEMLINDEFEFEENSNSKLDWFMNFLSGKKEEIKFGEIDKNNEITNCDTKDELISNLIKEKQKTGLEFKEAFISVQRDKPELFIEK